MRSSVIIEAIRRSQQQQHNDLNYAVAVVVHSHNSHFGNTLDLPTNDNKKNTHNNQCEYIEFRRERERRTSRLHDMKSLSIILRFLSRAQHSMQWINRISWKSSQQTITRIVIIAQKSGRKRGRGSMMIEKRPKWQEMILVSHKFS